MLLVGRGFPIGVLLLFTLGKGASVRAEPPPAGREHGGFVLDWSAPAGCPEPSAVRATVEGLLGSPRGAGAAGSLAVRATVVRQDDGRWALTLATVEGRERGERVLEGPTCQAVADAAALIVALAVDPDASPGSIAAHAAVPASRGASDSPAALAAPQPDAMTPASGRSGVARSAHALSVHVHSAHGLSAHVVTERSAHAAPAIGTRPNSPAASAPRLAPASAPSLRRPAAALPASPSSPRFHLSLSGALDAGTLPSVAPGVAAEVGLRFGRVDLFVGARVLPSERRTVDNGAGGDFWLAGGAAGACAVALRTPLLLSLCTEVALDAVSGRGFGVDRAITGRALFGSLGLGTHVVVPLGAHLGLRLALGARVPLDRPRFVLGGVGAVYRVAPVTGQADLGLEARF